MAAPVMHGLGCADHIVKVVVRGSVPSGLWDVANMGSGMVSEGLQGEAGESSAHLFSEGPWGRVRGITSTHGKSCQAMFAQCSRPEQCTGTKDGSKTHGPCTDLSSPVCGSRGFDLA